MNDEANTDSVQGWGYTKRTHQLIHNLATGRYAWLCYEDNLATNWYPNKESALEAVTKLGHKLAVVVKE